MTFNYRTKHAQHIYFTRRSNYAIIYLWFTFQNFWELQRTAYTKSEVTFGVRKAMYGRRGWMVMPLEDTIDLKAFKPEVMDTVTSKIRTMELSGIDVPNQIKIRLSEC